jgi:pimeloyl-ACP methyl ester carboxylesterase
VSPTSREDRWLLPFLAGVLTGALGLVLTRTLAPRRGLDLRLLGTGRDKPITPVVVVPGILGSELLRPDGTHVWLNLGNVFGSHELAPAFDGSYDIDDGLRPGALLGADAVLPRLFGFAEYADLLDLLHEAGFAPLQAGALPLRHVFAYDWRQDLVASARRLGQELDALAEALGDPEARFNVIGNSMGGLVARHYLRYGGAEPVPGGAVTWAGARRIQTLLLVTTPSGGSIMSLDAILNGNRVGLSNTTLAAPVISRMPSIYHLLPPVGVPSLLDEALTPLDADLHDVESWRRFGWGPFRASKRPDEHHQEFVSRALFRVRAFYEALARPPETTCPVRVVLLGGDCLPTPARALVPKRPGSLPRFEPFTRQEADLMYSAGDGRVTRNSILACHLPSAEENDFGSGMPELSQVFLGATDHHGIYSDLTFQSVILRTLLRPVRRHRPAPDAAAS